MSEIAILVVAAGVVVIAAIAVRWAWQRFRGDRLNRLLTDIAFDRLDGVILPNGDEGEIQIDHLLLTSQGLLVLHVKEVQGRVFGSDKMSDWTVIAPERRFTFSNPQPALLDRVAAVRHVVRDVPVEGRVLFLDGAEFTKGVPQYVVTVSELDATFREADKAAATRKVDAFKPYWEKLKRESTK